MPPTPPPQAGLAPQLTPPDLHERQLCVSSSHLLACSSHRQTSTSGSSDVSLSHTYWHAAHTARPPRAAALTPLTRLGPFLISSFPLMSSAKCRRWRVRMMCLGQWHGWAWACEQSRRMQALVRATVTRKTDGESNRQDRRDGHAALRGRARACIMCPSRACELCCGCCTVCCTRLIVHASDVNGEGTERRVCDCVSDRSSLPRAHSCCGRVTAAWWVTVCWTCRSCTS